MYRTIETSMWSDPKIRALCPKGKLLFVYLVTNNHTHVSGIYYLPNVLAQHETGLENGSYDTLCHTLSERDLVNFDNEHEVVWVKNMFRHQGRGEKNIIAASMHLKSLHNSILCIKFSEKYPDILSVKNGYRIDTLSLGHSMCYSQEQEQEQEQEQLKIKHFPSMVKA
jgi:hypothetical protein